MRVLGHQKFPPRFVLFACLTPFATGFQDSEPAFMHFRVCRMRPVGIAATVFPEFVACEIAVQERPQGASAVKAAVQRNRVQKRTKCPLGLEPLGRE